MIAVIIGIISGFLVIGFLKLIRNLQKPVMYSFILTGIGFLYVGFTWSHLPSLVLTSVQALAFIFLAYLGLRKNSYFLIAGFFLHGAWDIFYNVFPDRGLIPPHYDLFCWSIDFTMGFYLLISHKQYGRKQNATIFCAEQSLPGRESREDRQASIAPIRTSRVEPDRYNDLCFKELL